MTFIHTHIPVHVVCVYVIIAQLLRGVLAVARNYAENALETSISFHYALEWVFVLARMYK